ncbi:hypothetical protein Q5752_007102 [Cryptotrichosporon argae]
MAPIAVAVPEPSHGKVLEAKPAVAASEDEVLAINTIRALGADLCQQFKGGHPGTVMGAASIALALWKYHMCYNPSNAAWFGRDRFVLSAGHACLLQYIMLHLAGYSSWTLHELKRYHSPNYGKAAGHPEIEYEGIEVTTGPLGQGIANAVGLAIAGKNLAATYNKDGYEIIQGKIWCFTGDGCLQEGVGQEAISLAGHLALDNLVLLYDNNSVTVDGTIANCFTDDVSAKMTACGWHVLDVYDGSNDVAAVSAALEAAKTSTAGKPVFVNIRTVIGVTSRYAGQGRIHGQALGDDEVAYVKAQLGFRPEDKFAVPPKVYDFFADCKTRGQKAEDEWDALYAAYGKAHPELAQELASRIKGDLTGWEELVPPKSELPTAAQPTRKSSGIMVQALAPRYRNFMVGSADLLESTFVSWPGMVEFQNPKTGLGDYAGRQIRYGIREFAMVAIGNGLAAYQRGMFLPVMSTFFMFWLYAAPAARMSSLQGLRFIGIATHDSIGIGEDGPTHQPVALSSFYRSMPNFNFVRPADAEEVMGAWQIALKAQDTPSLFALSRQAVPLLPGSSRDGVAKGGYIIHSTTESDTPDLVLLATGAEVARAISVADALAAQFSVRVVSLPSLSHFDAQPIAYRHATIPPTSLTVAIEAWSSLPWARYAHAGAHMHTFGLSAPQEKLFDVFGFGVDNLTNMIGGWAEALKEGNGYRIPRVGEFTELLNGYYQPHH